MTLAKRLFDLFWSILGLIIIFPLLIIVSILIKIDDKGPIFFRQERVGYKGKPFKMWKFRTMVVNAEKKGLQLTIGKDPRITRVGNLLRKSKIDELPQLFNVIAGEMSLVGPRPEVPYYVAMYDDNQRKVLDIMPGITDPSSIEYRDESELLSKSDDSERTYIEEIMPEKIRLNLEYAQKANVFRDFVVIVKTLLKILK
ncbi:MAG: sugar transferase [Armatimonadota bacterium]